MKVKDLFENALGGIVAEVDADKINLVDYEYVSVGTVTKE